VYDFKFSRNHLNYEFVWYISYNPTIHYIRIYKKKIYEQNLIFKHVVLYQLKTATTTIIQSLITVINA
jgi:ABC-type polysaccharide/polyol phosphate export permease